MKKDKDNNQNLDEDTVVEMDNNLDDSVIAEENAIETIKKLRLKLKEEQKKTSEYLTGWQRAQADFVNFTKRSEEEKKDFVKFANENLVLEVLDVLDSFDRAFSSDENLDEKTKEGVILIHKQLVKILEKNGVVENNPLGEDFDPNKHMAVQMVPVDNEKDADKIVEVMQKGYSLSGKIIRASKVKVGSLN